MHEVFGIMVSCHVHILGNIQSVRSHVGSDVKEISWLLCVCVGTLLLCVFDKTQNFFKIHGTISRTVFVFVCINFYAESKCGNEKKKKEER